MCCCGSWPFCRPAPSAGPAGRQRVSRCATAAASGLRAGDDQPAAGGDLRLVQLPGDARPGRGQPGAAGRGGPPRGRRASGPGCWLIWTSPKPRSRLRVREPRRLPRGLDRAETAALLASFRTDRDRAIAGLMLFSGLRSAEVLGLRVRDVDIGRGWVRVIGKGDKERRVPLDPDVAGLVQTYLLAERPDTDSRGVVRGGQGPAPGPAADRGRAAHGLPLPPGDRPGCRPGIRTRCGTRSAPRWPRPGWTWPVLQALMGHDHVDSSAAYIHLAPAHVRAAYDAARDRQRARQLAAAPRPAAAAGRAARRATWLRWPARGAGNTIVLRRRPARSWPAGPTRRPGPAQPLAVRLSARARSCGRC